MGSKCYIIRYGEIAIKGKNRHLFERFLVDNIKKMLLKYKLYFNKIERVYGRMILFSDDDCSNCLKNIFGIVSFSLALKSLDINEALKFYTGGSFRVSTQRISKDYPFTSQEMNEKIGGMIIKQTGAKVDLKNFDCEIGVEIIGKDFFFFNKRMKGLGGLPVGVEGKVGVYCEGKESLVAAYLIMKRGCEALFFGKNIDVSLLDKYTPYDQKISKNTPKNIVAIITQDTIKKLRKHDFKMTVLRPLIGLDDGQIKKLQNFIA